MPAKGVVHPVKNKQAVLVQVPLPNFSRPLAQVFRNHELISIKRK